MLLRTSFIAFDQPKDDILDRIPISLHRLKILNINFWKYKS